MTSRLPLHRGQGNEPFRDARPVSRAKRGQVVPYGVNGATADHNHDDRYPTDAEVNTAIAAAIAALVDSSPATLDTLNELAAALGDDPNFAATITAALAGKSAIGHAHTMAEVGDLPTLAYGSYTPTLTGTSNTTAVTLGNAFYTRLGKVVEVSVEIVHTATAASTDTIVQITLPVAVDITTNGQLVGQGVANHVVSKAPGPVYGGTGSDVANYRFTAPSTAAVNHYVGFRYLLP